MIDIPRNPSDPISLADWLELTALEEEDGNASLSDLRQITAIPSDVVADVSVLALDFGTLEGNDPQEELEMHVMRELERRSTAAGPAYPFDILERGVLQQRENWREFRTYVFCLCLSYIGRPATATPALNPYHLFEELSCLACKNYIQGDAYGFGLACIRGRRPFESAVNQLCQAVGEGAQFQRRGRRRVQDAKVDIVAWKHFPDRMSSKLLLFGQCAGGQDWKDKLREMDPRAFWDNWILDPAASPLLRSFYVPHRIDVDDWDDYARNSGILFDRCRIAFWAGQDGSPVHTDDRYVSWCRTVLPALA